MADEKVKIFKLIDLIELVDKYDSKEITIEDLDDLSKSMTINIYVPLVEKMKIVMAITTRYIYSDADINEVRVAEMLKDIFYFGLLQGYGNVDCSDLSLMTFENYDKLYPIFAPFLLTYCKDDFEVLKEYLHDTIDLYGTRAFIEAVNGISAEELKKATLENNKLMRELGENKDLIRDLKEIAAMNNPATQKLVNDLKKAAKKEVKQGAEKKAKIENA